MSNVICCNLIQSSPPLRVRGICCWICPCPRKSKAEPLTKEENMRRPKKMQMMLYARSKVFLGTTSRHEELSALATGQGESQEHGDMRASEQCKAAEAGAHGAGALPMCATRGSRGTQPPDWTRTRQTDPCWRRCAQGGRHGCRHMASAQGTQGYCPVGAPSAIRWTARCSLHDAGPPLKPKGVGQSIVGDQ